MISVKFENNKLVKSNVKVEEKTFESLSILEKNIEDYLEENIGDLFSVSERNGSFTIIGKQTMHLGKFKSDLLAIDMENGDLVLIEIKRDVRDIKGRGQTFVAQAIKYASDLVEYDTKEKVVSLYAEYLFKKKSADMRDCIDEARSMIYGTFKDRKINTSQRIILIASEFDEVSISSAKWLSEQGVKISLIRLIPKIINGDLFIDYETLIDDPESYLNYDNKNDTTESHINESKISKRSLPRMPKLFEWELIKPGDSVFIKRAGVISIETKAVVIDENYVKFNDVNMSYNEWGQRVTGWTSIQIYKFMVVNDSKDTLHEVRMSKLQELEQIEE